MSDFEICVQDSPAKEIEIDADGEDEGLLRRSSSPEPEPECTKNGAEKPKADKMKTRGNKNHRKCLSASRSRSRSSSNSCSRSRNRHHKTKTCKRRLTRSRSRSPHYKHKHSKQLHSKRSPCRRREYEHERQEHERRTDEQRPSCCNGRNGSPVGSRKQYLGDRENPVPNRCIGVFGLSLYTQEKGLWEVFGRCGQISEVQVVYDRQTGRSRGFAFVYFRSTDDAYEAKYRCDGMEIDGRKIRVDFSITGGPHPPTPGVYLGRPCDSSRRSPDRRPSSYQRSVSPYSCGYRHSCPQDR